MKKLIILTFFGFLIFSLKAQSLQSEVIGSAGHYFQDATIGSLHGTLGQLATETFENGAVLTQGFQQFYLITTPVSETSIEPFFWRIYPNPTIDIVSFETNLTGDLLIELLDLNGKQLRKINIEDEQTQFKLGGLPDATYLLRLSKKGKPLKSWKVQKIQ